MMTYIKSRSIPDIRAGLIKIITGYATPKKIICDNEPALKSIEIRSLFQRLNIQVEYTPSNHSQSNGLVERFHSTLSEIFRCIKEKHDDLSQKQIFKIALGLYNQTIHSAHKHKPCEVLFGQRDEDDLPLDLERLFENREEIADEVMLKLEKSAKNRTEYQNRFREKEPQFKENEEGTRNQKKNESKIQKN